MSIYGQEFIEKAPPGRDLGTFESKSKSPAFSYAVQLKNVRKYVTHLVLSQSFIRISSKHKYIESQVFSPIDKTLPTIS